MHALSQAKVWLLGILFLLLNPATANSQTLQNQINQAFAFLKQGSISAAHQQFLQMEADYGTHAAYKDEHFQFQLLPIRAHTAYFAQDFLVAAQLYKNWIQILGDDLQSTMLAQFQLARCYRALEQSEKACQHYKIVYTHTSNPNEAAIAQLYHAKQLYLLDRRQEAQNLLQVALQASIAPSLQGVIKVYALKMAHLHWDFERIQSLMSEIDWHNSMRHAPKEFNFALMSIANTLFDNADYKNALDYYRSALPHQNLLEKMNQVLATSLQHVAHTEISDYSISLLYFQDQIDTLSTAREELESRPDYNASLYLKMGQCWLLNGRPHEAIILFSRLSTSSSFSTETRSQAHYCWVLTLIEHQQWDQAQACAQEFLRLYPAHPLIPDLRHLIVQSLERQNRFEEAIEHLKDLIDNYPHHIHQQRWQFSCGYVHTRLERFESARHFYEKGLSIDLQSSLSTKIKLWHALSYYFEGDYSTSQNALEQLQVEAHSSPLYPEILFRLANIYYAQKAYAKSQATLINLCDHFAEHPRNPQALALLGDIYGICGHLKDALASYALISPEQGSSFEYALFQAVKIYRLTDQKVRMRQELENYLALPDAAKRPRVSEALYWLGWSYSETEEYAQAMEIFEHALDRFDDDPHAQSIDAILIAYQRLYPQVAEARPEGPKHFIAWLERRTQDALVKNRLTRYARLQSFQALKINNLHRNCF